MPVIKRKIVIGSASENHEMRVEGITSFQMFLTIESKPILLKINSLVIKDLTDQINIGSYFLKEYNVSLKFSNDEPLILNFKDLGIIQSVGSLTDKRLPAPPVSTSCPPVSTSCPPVSNFLPSQNVKFGELQGMVFKLKAAKTQFLAPNMIGQVKCFIDSCPPNDFCSIVIPNSHIDSNVTGGILKRVKAPNSEYFEYKTLERPIQLRQGEVLGAVIFINNEQSQQNDVPFIEKDDFDPANF